MKKISKIRDSLCTGCCACYNVCPVGAISMVLKDGFEVPSIDESKCINCEKCDNVCPIYNCTEKYKPRCYAAWGTNEERLECSSGGAFAVIAKYVLEKEGIVFGASWTDDFYVKHIWIDSKENLWKLCRSKYAQSYIGNSYKKVKEFLSLGKYVMFVGTPCQIAALDSFLGDADRSRILLVDFICYYNPPIDYVRAYLDEQYGLDKLKEFHFRDKVNGWICHGTGAVLSDGTEVHENRISSFFNGYFNGLFCRDACTKCTYSGQNHYSDITLGDFWKIEDHDPSWNDGRGTSMIISRSTKGERIIQTTSRVFSRIENVPLEWIRAGQTNCKKSHLGHQYFKDLYKQKSFSEAVDMALKGKHDIGLVCVQNYVNYGSALTNYALYNVLKDFGFSVLIITQPISSEIKPSKWHNFATIPWKSYEVASSYETQENMRCLNNSCKVFLLGSDQLFNYEIYRRIDGFIKMDWVDDAHDKLCYATSFGVDKILGPSDEQEKMKQSLSRFKAISIREESGVKLLKEKFSLEGIQLIDPVFLCNPKHFYDISEKFSIQCGYVFAYILDPTVEKAETVKCLAEHGSKKCIAIADRWMSEELINNCWHMETIVGQKNEEWLAYIRNSDYVVTDSFHGMCFAIIFHKQFVVINNKKRGSTRFESLLKTLELSDRLYDDIAMLKTDIISMPVIDYNRVDVILAKEIKKGQNWLKENLCI